MSTGGIGPRFALGERDVRRVADAVDFIRATGTREALDAVLPGTDLARHLEFAHGALLVAGVSAEQAAADLARLGVTPRDPVARERPAWRLGPDDPDVRVVRGVVGDGPRGVVLVVCGGRGVVPACEDEPRLVFRATSDDDVVLRGVYEAVAEAGPAPDGGGYDRSEDATVLHFRGGRRLALAAPGRRDALLLRHLGRPDQAGRDMLHLMSGAWRTRSLAVVAELGVADLLADGPKSTAELAAATGVREDNLRRVLRYLASLGVFAVDGDTWSSTDLGALLRSDVDGSQRDLARLYGGLFYRSFGALEHTVRTGESAFTHVFGADPFDHFAAHPADARLFESAMASGASFLRAVPGALDLPAEGAVVDVAGGDGHLLAYVLRAAPRLRGALFDRPHVIGAARAVLAGHGLAGRVELVAGDFFRDPVPPGGAVYLLSRILHDWDDERCGTILRNVRSAAAPGATLAIVERPIPESRGGQLPLAWDVHMMVNNVHGRERTPSEYRKLLCANGFRLDEVRPLPLDMAVLVATATG
ncbi:methyltransferase [Saccharothrix australiensis]|uniref:O-methyltransferase n=1 Tax=Saccharothrix australiensis TaxID=2072 RepID=A0A495W064_9PSEU|nr:methyltransferase [Saccharothrix australiensis]RKT55082.1 O-methyltransferase [Saccharothrix australiensis]